LPDYTALFFAGAHYTLYAAKVAAIFEIAKFNFPSLKMLEVAAATFCILCESRVDNPDFQAVKCAGALLLAGC
jgi:hypothetical protein